MDKQNFDLDDVIHQPIRTKIMTYLANVGEADYTVIKKSLGLNDGHMSTHMKKLIEANYVVFIKEFVNNKPKTTYLLTPLGRDKYKAYIAIFKKMIGKSS